MPHETSSEENTDQALSLNAPHENSAAGQQVHATTTRRPTTTTSIVAQVLGPGPFLSEEEADKLYDQRIEDEYAKREGGA